MRLASAILALWQCQWCDCTNDSTKNKRRCFLCRAWRDGVLQQGRNTTASVTLYGTIWYFLRHCLHPPPGPCLFFCCLLCCRPPSAAHHPPPIICCLLLLQNSPPNLANCADLSHCQPPATRHLCDNIASAVIAATLSSSQPLLLCCLHLIPHSCHIFCPLPLLLPQPPPCSDCSCCTFHRPLLLHRPTASATTLPPPLPL